MVPVRPVICIQKVIIDELFESLFQNYQKDLEESMRGSNFVFDSVDLLYYHLKKTFSLWYGKTNSCGAASGFCGKNYFDLIDQKSDENGRILYKLI